ncbi:hypothetical protein JY651_45780 [Pyxidicoccus parkwayensis]|uniref:Uncharacterized protein n=1 Tax=Pyxidicoccus parkwayensis TaxID=2813578 RepID=A0ABX7P1H2_9BACT|nr:hypothetical protein [Pyxidicoccus parkwaysis]QSQ22358.1 hypothetical protein JY651_45780 [Pyxidicoccus parkwaysis]
MTPDERVRRPEPVRTQPIRNWWTMFGPPEMPPRPAATGMGAAPPPTDPVSRGVEMGYRVIEEYMRQGQNVARMMGAPYAGGGMGPEDGMPQRMATLMRSFADFAGLWMEMMGTMGPAGFAPRAPDMSPPQGTAGPFSVGAAAPEPPHATPAPAPVVTPPEVLATPGVTLELDARRRAEVSIDLRPRSAGMPLRLHDLRAPEPDVPRITGARLETAPEDDRVTLRLRIPDDHPAGIYSGLILDERTGMPRGTVTVRLFAP